MLSSAQQYMKMFRSETEAIFDKRWEEERKSYPEEEQYRYVAKHRNIVAKELYDAATPAVKKLVDDERMKGRQQAASAEEESSEGDEEGENMGEDAKEAKLVAQAEKKVKADNEQALAYQQ